MYYIFTPHSMCNLEAQTNNLHSLHQGKFVPLNIISASFKLASLNKLY